MGCTSQGTGTSIGKARPQRRQEVHGETEQPEGGRVSCVETTTGDLMSGEREELRTNARGDDLQTASRDQRRHTPIGRCTYAPLQRWPIAHNASSPSPSMRQVTPPRRSEQGKKSEDRNPNAAAAVTGKPKHPFSTRAAPTEESSPRPCRWVRDNNRLPRVVEFSTFRGKQSQYSNTVHRHRSLAS